MGWRAIVGSMAGAHGREVQVMSDVPYAVPLEAEHGFMRDALDTWNQAELEALAAEVFQGNPPDTTDLRAALVAAVQDRIRSRGLVDTGRLLNSIRAGES